MRAEAVKDKAVFVKMMVRQKPVKFQVDCGARAYVLERRQLKYVKGEDLSTRQLQTLTMLKLHDVE